MPKEPKLQENLQNMQIINSISLHVIFLTILVEELVDCHLLRVEKQGCHVIICVVVAEEASYG